MDTEQTSYSFNCVQTTLIRVEEEKDRMDTEVGRHLTQIDLLQVQLVTQGVIFFQNCVKGIESLCTTIF